MAKCDDCGERIGFNEISVGVGTKIYCSKCGENVDKTKVKSINTDKNAKNSYSIRAYVLAPISFIVLCLISLEQFLGGEIILGLSIMIGGCIGVMLLGLLAEISANVAILVNKSQSYDVLASGTDVVKDTKSPSVRY